jgi:hypothetical protein
MPFATNESVPPDVKERYSGHCLTVWREAWNDTYRRHQDEGRAFATAELAGKQCKESTKTMATVKFADGSDNIIEGLAIPFNAKDLDGDTFTPDTEFCLDWFPNEGRPLLYHHGLNDTVKTSVIGRQIEKWTDDAGIWIKAELDKSSRYWSRVKELIDKGAVGFSSGAVDHLFEGEGGRIKRWAWVEQSLTPIPANPNRVTYAVKSTDALAHLVISDTDVPDPLKEVATEDGSEPESFAAHGQRVKADLDAFAERVESRIEARHRGQKKVSRANLDTIRAVAETLAPFVSAHARLAELIANNDPEIKEAAKREHNRYLALEAARHGVPITPVTVETPTNG